jgi:parvulin-like peptidyl-prolyl isomerase
VGERPVEFGDFAAYVKSATGDEPRNASPRVASSLLDQYLEELLVERAVEDNGPSPKNATPAERRRDLIAKRAGLEALGEAEFRAEYAAHPDRYRRPAVVRVSQLLFRKREVADTAMKNLKAGAAWIDVSRELSLAPNAATGGSLGLLSQGDLPEDFARVLWNLPAGGTTGILEAPHGFHVFRVEERFDAKEITFEEALPALRLTVAEDRSSRAAESIVRDSRQRHPVFVVEEHLPFPYVGATPRWTEPR